MEGGQFFVLVFRIKKAYLIAAAGTRKPQRTAVTDIYGIAPQKPSVKSPSRNYNSIKTAFVNSPVRPLRVRD